MSLKRLLNDQDDDCHYAAPPSISSYGSITASSYQSIDDYSGTYPRQTQFQPKDCQHSIPVLEGHSSLNDVFNGILFDHSTSNHLASPGLGDSIEDAPFNLELALEKWGHDMTTASLAAFGSNVSNSPQLSSFSGSGSSQDSVLVTNSPSLAPESSVAGSDSCSSVGDDEVDKVCYGMLHNVDVKLIGNMAVIDNKLCEAQQAAAVAGTPGRTNYQRFALSEHQDHVLLSFRDVNNTDFGYLRSGPAKTLSRLLNQAVVDFEPIASIASLSETIRRAKKPVEAMIRVDINIYGPRSASQRVSDSLSDGKLWLQKPGHRRKDVPYENPHLLQFHDLSIEHLAMTAADHVNYRDLAKQQPPEEQLRKMVIQAYGSLKSRRQRVRVEGGEGLRHELLPHQEEALAFMLKRESGSIDPAYRLWQPVQVDGQEWFRHKITRVKQRIRPDERGGGVLADEAGMGKSLSILSLIVKTLESGREWAKQSDDGNKELNYSGSTLVVVSSALLISKWMNEVDKHVDGHLKTIRYHGSSRERDVDKIKNSQVVVTTYNTLSAEYEKKSSILHRIGWYRVVLDDAHIVRRPATTFYHACRVLHANSRWCLTGTPIQNRLSDIGALFSLIRASPFDDLATFRKYIETPFEQQSDGPQKVKDRLIMLLESLCLRRTKDLLNLPGIKQVVKKLKFSAKERKQYDNTKTILIRTIRQKVGEVEKSSKFSLFQANLQLRILCNHGTFQKTFTWHRRAYRLDEREAVVSALAQSAEITCDGCRQPMPIVGSSRLRNEFEERCAHVLCSECLEESESAGTGLQSGGLQCPVCDSWIKCARSQRALPVGVPTVTVNGPASAGDIDMPDAPSPFSPFEDECYFNPTGCSTKMQAVMCDIKEDLWETKSIVLSCWTRTLQLVASHLEEAGVGYLRIDGDCPLHRRQDKLDEFAKAQDKRVLIMTTGTAAFGLDLTCANRVFIIEPQWNPSVEDQAIARALRLGQSRQVLVTRYVMEETVEEEMSPQQNVKKYPGFNDKCTAVEDTNDLQY